MKSNVYINSLTCYGIALVVLLATLNGCAVLSTGSMLPGKIYKTDGTLLTMEIEISSGHGKMIASNTKTGEALSGTYSGVSEGFIPGAPVEKSTRFDAVATLIGDKGTVLNCVMKIQGGVWLSEIHGSGTCTDSSNIKYQVQF